MPLAMLLTALVNLDFFRFLANVNMSSRSLCCRQSVCRVSVTLVRPTQPVEIFGNVPTPFDTLAIR